MNILASMITSLNQSKIAPLTSVCDRTIHMFPGATVDDMANSSCASTKGRGKLTIAFTFYKSLAYLYYLLGCEFSTPVLGTASVKAVRTSVLPITNAGIPTQIVQVIISVITVVVASFHTVWAWTYEGLKYKAMDKAIMGFTVTPKRDSLLSQARKRLQ